MLALVSYPKSGNTWLKFIFANLYSENITFDKAIELIPTIESEEEMKMSNTPVMFKSHLLNLPEGINKVVYLVRHVCDVLVSFYHYNRGFHNYGKSINDFVVDMSYGQDWRDHVNSWLSRDVFFIRYKELLTNPVDTVCRIVSEFDMGFTKSAVREAVQKSSFKRMREIEVTNGLGIYKGSNFVRKGKYGSWIEELPECLWYKIIEASRRELEMIC